MEPNTIRTLKNLFSLAGKKAFYCTIKNQIV